MRRTKKEKKRTIRTTTVMMTTTPTVLSFRSSHKNISPTTGSKTIGTDGWWDFLTIFLHRQQAIKKIVSASNMPAKCRSCWNS